MGLWYASYPYGADFSEHIRINDEYIVSISIAERKPQKENSLKQVARDKLPLVFF